MSTLFSPSDLGVFFAIPGDNNQPDPNAFGCPVSIAQELGFTGGDSLARRPKDWVDDSGELINSKLAEAGLVDRRTLFVNDPADDYSSIAKASHSVLVDMARKEKPNVDWWSLPAFAPLMSTIKQARALKFANVGLHAGSFTPEDLDPMEDVFRWLVHQVESAGLNLLLETSAVPATLIAALLGRVNNMRSKPILFNVDPANFILYGQGAPINLVRTLANNLPPESIRFHAKSAKARRKLKFADPWLGAREMPIGKGDVNFAAIAYLFWKHGIKAPWTIENEMKDKDAKVLADARDHIVGAITFDF